MKKIITLLSLSAALTFTAPAPQLHAEDAPAKRLVLVTFLKPKDGPPVNGTLVVSYVNPDIGTPRPVIGTVTIKDERCVFEVPANVMLTVLTGKMSGYQSNFSKTVAVHPGKYPLELKLDLRPAGVITGVVRNADGAPLGGGLTQAIVFSKDRFWMGGDTFIESYYIPVKDGNFSIQPIPFSGRRKYYVVLNHGGNLIISEPVYLEQEKPTAHVELKFKRGMRIYGKLQDERRQPIADYQLFFYYKIDDKSMTARLPSLRTKADGSFEIPAINFDAIGGFSGYQIIVPESKKYEKQTIDLEDDMKLPLIITAEDQ